MDARKSLLVFIISVIINVFNLLILYFAIRKYSSWEFGYLAVATSFSQFFYYFSDMNFCNIHVKKMAEKNMPPEVYFNVYLFIKIILILFVSVISTSIIIFNIKNATISSEPIQFQIITIMLFVGILSSFNLVYTLTLQSQMYIVKMQTSLIIGKIANVIFALYAVFFTNNIIYYVIATLLNQIVILIFNIYFTREIKIKKPDKELFKNYISFGLLVLPASLMNITWVNFGPIFFLNYYNEDLLGVYYIISIIISFLNLIPIALLTIINPNFSLLMKQKKYKELHDSIKSIEKYLVLLSGMLIIITFNIGKDILSIFFNDFYAENGIMFFYFSIVFTLHWGLYYPYSTLIFVSENKIVLNLNELIFFSFTLISWFYLIPKYIILGINLGFWIGLIVNIIINRSIIYKKFKIGKMENSIWLSLLFIFLLTITGIILNLTLNLGLFFKIGITLGLICLFILLLFIFKILTSNDLTFMIDLINPVKMLNDIKKDLNS